MKIHLERIAPEERMAQFYTVIVAPTLLGEWAVIREWGRLGQGGTVREKVFASEATAQASAGQIIEAKQRRGYAAPSLDASSPDPAVTGPC